MLYPRVSELVRNGGQVKLNRQPPRRSLCENAHKLDPHR